MNFRTATLLIIGMFGSFSVIIVTMMVLFWPGSKSTSQPSPRVETRSATLPKVKRESDRAPRAARGIDNEGSRESLPRAPAPDPAPIKRETPQELKVPSVATPKPEEASDRPSEVTESGPTGNRASREIRIEQDEIRLLRSEMEKRLKQQLELHERKLTQLARQCASLEAGAATQVLMNLDDDTAREVLKRMDRSTALNIAAILVRLGRVTALPTHHEEN